MAKEYQFGSLPDDLPEGAQVVYFVEEGEYSDYTVVGVTSTPDKAEAYCVGALPPGKNPEDAPRWRAVVVDERMEPPKPYWKAWIDMLSGEIRILPPTTFQDPPNNHVPTIYPSGVIDRAGLAYSGRDQDHANKVAVELRQAFLRRMGGVTNLSMEGTNLLRVKDPKLVEGAMP